METVKWYHYVAAFFAGAFLTNAVPHFVNGISGDFFPTPFAEPPGKGLSSPLTNVLWAFFNLIAGYLLFRLGRKTLPDRALALLFFIGAFAISIWLSMSFAEKEVMAYGAASSLGFISSSGD